MRLVLVHSPYLGPGSWQPTADQLRALGWPVDLPDLRRFVRDRPCSSSFIAAAGAAIERAPSEQSIVIAHSRAGALLPAIASTQPRADVAALLYVDAVLPTPGRSWADEAPPERVASMRQLGRDGSLPRWSEWWDDHVLEQLIPDAPVRAGLLDEQPRVPTAFLDEPMPLDDWHGPSGYLQLSSAYATFAQDARARGWPVEERALDHLATVTAPADVAAAIQALLARLELAPPSTARRQ